MKTGKLREQTDEELAQLLVDAGKDLFNLQIKKGTGDSSEQPLRIRTVRKELARIKTIIRERSLKGDQKAGGK